MNLKEAVPDSRREQLIELLENKTEEVTSRLDRNWLYQFLLGVLGLTYVLSPATVNDIAPLTPLKEIPLRFFAIVIPVLLTYTFVNFGYILNHFLTLRALYDVQLEKQFVPDILDKTQVTKAFEKQTLFEALYYMAQRRLSPSAIVPFAILLLLGLSVIVLNHVAAFGIVAKHLDGGMRIGVLTPMAVLVTACYCQFFFAQRSPRIRWLAVFIYGVALGLTIIMWAPR